MWGRRWQEVLGTYADSLSQLAFEAVRARYPKHAPQDALEEIGETRSMPRGPSEPWWRYRLRLVKAFSTHQFSGTNDRIVEQLGILGYSARIIQNNMWVVDANSGNVANYWARFWTLISNADTAGWGDAPICGGGAICGYGGPICGVSGTTVDEITRIFSTIRKWQSSHAQLVSVIALVSGHVAGDGSLCGAGLLCGGTTVTLTG